MEFDRRVQLRVVRAGGAAKGFGSGYLVAPRLVLTAAHVLDGMDPSARQPLTVCRPDADPRQFPATVRWLGRSEAVDAALVEIDEGHGWRAPGSLGDLLARPPQRYGLVVGTRPCPVALTGFPRMQRDTDGRRLDEQLTGQLLPGTGTLARRYELAGRTPAPSGGEDGRASRWSGVSGAAVLADADAGGDLLCGVVRRDRRADGGTRLTATPAAVLLADDAFRTLIAEHTGWEPALEPVEPAALLAPAAVSRQLNSPAALLRADAEAVAFHGRAGELADLRAWCVSGPSALRVRVVTGPGGQGKTRLARRLTGVLGQEGWVTGHLRSDLLDPGERHDPPDLAALATALPLLLVVDYAETRPRLVRHLVTQLHRSRHRVRLLLLSRSDGEWRTDALGADPVAHGLLADAAVVPLLPLLPAGDRRDAFRRATADLARLLPRVPSVPAHDWTALAAGPGLPDDLDRPRYDNVLTLQLAALVHLLQHGPEPVEASPGLPPEEVLLRHEQRFWEAGADTPAFRLHLSTRTLKRAVAVAALCGAESEDEALRATRMVPGLPADKVPDAAAWLAALYPAPGSGRYWGSLQPDRLAEYHASRTLTDVASLSALLAAVGPAQQAQLITVLARAANADSNAGRVADRDRVLRLLDAALDGARLGVEAVGSAIAALPERSRATARLHVRLTAGLVGALRQLADIDRELVEPDLAVSLARLSNALAEVGRRDEALAAGEEAVRILRRPAGGDPAEHRTRLASTLFDLGARLAAVGRSEEALAASREAVLMFRGLAAGEPAAHESALAGALSGLSVDLASAGRHREALDAAEEAVRIRRRLAADDPAEHAETLAAELVNLGSWLAEVGRHREALDATEDAVRIHRRLAADDPAAHEPDLATSLNNLGLRLAENGHHQEALATTWEAVRIRRRLAADNPAAYEPDLAGAVFNLGVQLAWAGQHREALAAVNEAARIHHRLASANPAAHLPALATSLSELGLRLADNGHHREALTATEDAVRIRRRLAADNPAAHEPDLAASLNHLGLRLADAGRAQEAVAAGEEGVRIRRRLAAEDPAAHESDLAGSLNNLSLRLADVERHDEALTVTREAVEIFRRLAADAPARHEPALAAALSNLGSRLAAAARYRDALAAEEEAVRIRRRLAADDPAAYDAHLATSLHNLGHHLGNLRQFAEGYAAAFEALTIHHRLAAASPALHTADVACALLLLARLLGATGHLPEVLDATEEAETLYRSLVAARPSLVPELNAVLDLRAKALELMGRHQEAAEARRRKVPGSSR